MDPTDPRHSPVASPRAVALDSPDSTLDVVVRDDSVEFLPDSTRPIGNAAWVTVDRDSLVAAVHALR
jgi:ABC-type uncharacterized transport system YnjBCD ATPase subunit